MKNNIKNEALTACWKENTASGTPQGAAAALLDALMNGRFHFAPEAWLAPGRASAHELLLRAWNAEGETIAQEQALSGLFEQGMLPQLDRFIIYSALRKVAPAQDSAITINALCSTLASSSFWDELDRLPHAHDASRVVFEILEYETDYEVNHERMQAARGKGYQFALDDFTPDLQNWKRLEDFAPYLGYIKLDGTFVRSGLAGDPEFMETLSRLQSDHPGLQIIAEHVQTVQEAIQLFESGVSFVQGCYLMPGPPRPDLFFRFL